MGFSSCGIVDLVAVVHGLSFPTTCGIFPELEIEPMSPALAGEFFITMPPGKPHSLFICIKDDGDDGIMVMR